MESKKENLWMLEDGAMKILGYGERVSRFFPKRPRERMPLIR